MVRLNVVVGGVSVIWGFLFAAFFNVVSIDTAFADEAKHVQTLVLKNFERIIARGGGEYEYETIYVDVLTVHPNIVLKKGAGLGHADDAADAQGNAYFIYLVFIKSGLSSLVTRVPNLDPIPVAQLSADQEDILRLTITDLAASGCGIEVPAGASTEALAVIDLSQCVAKAFPPVTLGLN